MATKLINIGKISQKVLLSSPKGAINQAQVRCLTCNETGAFLEAPKRHRAGILKVLAVSLPFLYLGATAAKEGAEFLEENDIFVPSDDDDD